MSELVPHSPHALVVDDDFLIRMDAIDILEQAGFRVLEAEHAQAAYELLKSRQPDVVLRWSPFVGQVVKLGSPMKDGPDDGQVEAVFGGVQGQGVDTGVKLLKTAV